MNHNILIQMSAVTETMYQREYSAIRSILNEETVLRKSLAQLEIHSQAAKMDQVRDCTMKTIGADILWQGWVSKTKSRLNIELAQVMARKMDAMTQVRKAFGKKEAVKNLIKSARQEQLKKVNQRRSEQLSLFNKG